MFLIIEKNNPHAVHGIFDTEERAIRHLTTVIPTYVSLGYFMDKTLTPDSFVVVRR
jgi:hypothetical protein